jgi:hypothetical protein
MKLSETFYKKSNKKIKEDDWWYKWLILIFSLADFKMIEIDLIYEERKKTRNNKKIFLLYKLKSFYIFCLH